MANPTLLTMPLCVNADKNTIPPTDAGTSGLFSEEYGWQNINSLPLASGGKAPNRRDFNGVFALLGGIAYACQRGQSFEWVNTLPYLAGCVVTDPLDGNKYNAKNDVAEGGTNPSLDPTNWELFEYAQELATKANRDLSNLTDAGKSFTFPSDTYVDISAYLNSTYTAPADGYVFVGGNKDNLNDTAFVYITVGSPTLYQAGTISPYGANLACSVIIPIQKGQPITFAYHDVTAITARFIYAVGEVPA